eukprot:109804_1
MNSGDFCVDPIPIGVKCLKKVPKKVASKLAHLLKDIAEWPSRSFTEWQFAQSAHFALYSLCSGNGNSTPVDENTSLYLINEVLGACAQCAFSNACHMRALAGCVSSLSGMMLMRLPCVRKAHGSFGDDSPGKDVEAVM